MLLEPGARPQWEPSDEDTERLTSIAGSLRERSPVHVDPRDYELMLNMRDKILRLEDQTRRFAERPEIEDIARDQAKLMLENLGFDMEHIRETNSQIQFLMSIKRGVKGFIYAVLAAVLTVMGTLVSTYLTGKLFK